MDIKIKRGQLLKELRKKRNLNQNELATILNVSNQAYQKYEYGTAEPTFDNLSKLADFYGVTTDYLLGRTNEKLNPNKVLHFLFNSIKIKINNNEKLNTEKLEELLKKAQR